MSVALHGNLQDFGIADIFQLIGQQRKTGILEFRGEAGRVQLRFDRGAVVSAAPLGSRAEDALGEMLVRCGRLTRDQVDQLVPECEAAAQTVPLLAVSRGWISREDLDRIEDVLTRETFFEVLRWESGDFDFRAQPVEHGRRFEALLGAEQILMDGLRMVDEWQSFSEHVPSEDTVFRKTAGFKEYRSRSRFEASQLRAAERVYQLVDGRLPVRRIIDLSLLGTFDAVRLLAELCRAEVIEPLDEEAVRRVPTPPPQHIRVGWEQTVSWLAGLLPLLLLAGIAALALRGVAQDEPAAGFTLQRAPIEANRAAFEALRVRYALEAHRFTDGRWPEGLSELERRGVLAAGTLAQRPAGAYYYLVREDGALLLAPER